MISVAIVTPSIGAKTLQKTVESIKKQTHTNIVHHIFVDGKENLNKVESILADSNTNKYTSVNVIQENIGKGWYGHRVYAACSFLVNQDCIIYLDEDNWLEPDHVETMVERIEEGNDWAYSLRKIYKRDETYFCDDNCESLGKWPTYFDENTYHIDTSCFIVRRDVAVSVGHSWYGQWGADRQFFSAVSRYFPNFACSNRHTLCYRLGGNEGSVTENFFINGNKMQLEKYGSEEEYPWLKKEYTIGPGISIKV